MALRPVFTSLSTSLPKPGFNTLHLQLLHTRKTPFFSAPNVSESRSPNSRKLSDPDLDWPRTSPDPAVAPLPAASPAVPGSPEHSAIVKAGHCKIADSAILCSRRGVNHNFHVFSDRLCGYRHASREGLCRWEGERPLPEGSHTKTKVGRQS